MTMRVLLINSGPTIARYLRQERDANGQFLPTEPVTLKPGECAVETLWSGKQVVAQPDCVITVAAFEGPGDKVAKCELQTRDADGQFQGELSSTIVKINTARVISVGPSNQLQVHERDA
jgi:hypothetical protein